MRLPDLNAREWASVAPLRAGDRHGRVPIGVPETDGAVGAKRVVERVQAARPVRVALPPTPVVAAVAPAAGSQVTGR